MPRHAVVGIILSATLLACGSVDGGASPSAEVTAPVYSLSGSTPSGSLDSGKGAALAVAGAYALSQRALSTADLGLSIAASVVAYVVYDPLAPNWRIEERLIDRDTYQVSMRAKSFRIGGDGESGLILKRRALQLQRETGLAGYRIVDYAEGIESGTPFANRYATGVILLVRADPVGKH